ncbi:glutathione S-transferase family protein [Zopfochytrium polystomum]|nr:glutathione S-transferase family protein [Zopfochytrium polystomum]
MMAALTNANDQKDPVSAIAVEAVAVAEAAGTTAESATAAAAAPARPAMVLLGEATSPFTRKVRIVAMELGIDASRIELVLPDPMSILPVVPANAVSDMANPLGKVPALLPTPTSPRSDAIYGSQVIAQHLDAAVAERVDPSRHVLPPASAPAARVRVLTTEALADGGTEAVILTAYETLLRPEERRWDAWIEGQLSKAWRALSALEERVVAGDVVSGSGDDYGDDGPLDLGTIATGCFIGYFEFRLPHLIAWRDKHPALAAWYAKIQERPSFVATAPTTAGAAPAAQ